MIADNKLISFLRYTLSIHNIVYFVMGIYLSNHSLYILSSRNSFALLLCSILILIIKVYAESTGTTVPMVWRLLFCPLFMIALWSFIPDIKINPKILILSFPIYLIHYFMISIVIRCNIDINYFIGFIFSYIILLLGSAFVCIFIRKYMPKFIQKVLFGGR